MTGLLYSIFIFVYKKATWLASAISSKAQKRIGGLSDQKHRLPDQLDRVSSDRVLIHCASLGEYEQASPVVNWILENTKYDIVISFFSSSGYENCIFNTNRCVKCYLPFDLSSDMKEFLGIVKPNKVIITKNEWWWNLLHILKNEKIPTYLISSTIRADHYFLKYPLTSFTNGIKAFVAIFVLNQKSSTNLSSIYKGQIIVSGDTRKDKVLSTRKNNTDPNHRSQEKNIIYGSIWYHDLPVVKAMIKALPGYNHYVYPHELNDKNIKLLKSQLGCSVLDDISKSEPNTTCIIDSMGKLKSDYFKADIAYIGGGFGDGVHNILEAAVYGIPTIIGPNYHKSEEAKDLIDSQISFSISRPDNIGVLLDPILENESLESIRIKLKAYFSTHNSPTDIICNEIFK